MGIINVLDKQTANLIAAGEVVERPASAIKELLENCADAGATKVTVEIKNGGTTYIRVTDDGCGMSGDDLKTCILRHATSKIRTKEDLASIGTLGFRGEALAAIAAVTRLSIMTKRVSDSTGYHMQADFGSVTDFSEGGCADGTTIIARNLFENVPARRKFLKKDATEAHAVVAAVEKFALSKPFISVSCISDGVEKIKTPGDGIIANAIYAALGRDFSEGMIRTDYSLGGVSVSGFVCKPNLCRPNRSMQNFFINGRYVRSKTMCAALEEGFKSFCPQGKYPGAVLYLEIDNGMVDVNIHPAKLEVKFVNEKAIFETVFYAVRNALSRATSGSNLYYGGVSEDVPIDKIVKTFPPDKYKANDADSAHEDNGKTEEIRKSSESSEDKGNGAIESREVTLIKDAEKNKSSLVDMDASIPTPVQTTDNFKDKSERKSMSLDELAAMFDREKGGVVGDTDEPLEKDQKPVATPPSAGAPSQKHMEFIKSFDISIPSAIKSQSNDIKFTSEKLVGAVGRSVSSAKKEQSEYFKGITESVQKPSVSDEKTPETTEKVGTEDEIKRPPAKPLETTISMLDESDDGMSLIDTKAELEKRIKRGVSIIGEVFNAYIIVEAGGVLYLVDKHAAHERIIYEGMKNNSRKREGVQLLLEPINVSVSSKEAEAISESGDYIKNAGFVFEEFGHNSYLIRGLPPMVDMSDGLELFKFLAGKLADGNGRALGDIFDRALYTAACKAAVKAGQKTSALSNTVIIDKLFSDEGVLYCPHGRPVLIQFTKSKLDKMFGRT